MTTTNPLQGVYTALITPMNRDGSLDLGALDALVDGQLAAGIGGLVPCGTTGESVTLSADERDTVIARVVKRVNGKKPVIAGTGSNNTAATIEAQKRAKDLGVSHALVVTPYYNKPTPEGLYRHYEAIAGSVDLPIILYNVPGRTACDMKPETVGRLAKLANIVAVKEAAGDIDRVAAIRELCSPTFSILTGDDGNACAWTLMGGDGVVSVASNALPLEMVKMIQAALMGQVMQARTLHLQMRPLFNALFLESNPIPLKAFLALQGKIKEAYRLPLCEMAAANRDKLIAVMRAGGWLV